VNFRPASFPQTSGAGWERGDALLHSHCIGARVDTVAECSTPVVIALMSATPIKMLLKPDAVMKKLTARMTSSTSLLAS